MGEDALEEDGPSPDSADTRKSFTVASASNLELPALCPVEAAV